MNDQPVVRRFDGGGQLAAPQRQANGWVRVEGRIARAGVQDYRQADGSVRRELRLPDEVFDPAALASFAMVPVTNTHPPALLDADTARQYTVGAVGESIRRDGEWIVAPLLLTDREAIEALEAGRSQLSCGYDCKLDFSPGTWQGQRYDAVQRQVRGNHVAIVDTARAGPGASVRLDEGAACVVTSAQPPTPQPEKSMKTVKIDGLNLNVDDASADAIQQAHDRAVGDLRTKLDAASTAAAAAKVAADTAKTTLQAQLDAAKEELAKCPDCKGTGKIDGKKCDTCGGKGEIGEGDIEDDVDPSNLAQNAAIHLKTGNVNDHPRGGKKDARARADALARTIERRARLRATERADVETRARKVLGAAFKLDGLDDVAVMREAVKKRQPKAKLDGADAIYVRARFDALFEGEAPPAAPIDAARTGAPIVHTDGDAGEEGDRLDSESAREKFVKGRRDAWKTPTATK